MQVCVRQIGPVQQRAFGIHASQPGVYQPCRSTREDAGHLVAGHETVERRTAQDGSCQVSAVQITVETRVRKISTIQRGPSKVASGNVGPAELRVVQAGLAERRVGCP
jgi:hypothetical protein